MSPAPSPAASPRHRGGLFRRILAMFLGTAAAAAVVAAVAGYSFAARFSSEWVGEVAEAIELRSGALQAAGEDEAALAAIMAELGRELDAEVGVFGKRGRKIAGEGPPELPHDFRGRRKELRQGQPVVVRPSRLSPPGVILGLPDPETGRRPGFRLAVPLLSVAVMLVVLGAGAWVLSGSLTRRLAHIETGADRIAHGDLRHRIALEDAVLRDELDQLAGAFNAMAETVEALLQGQRTLLANVSHELRTPIARMKVLVEILQERVAMLRERGDDSRPVQRLDQGLRDMGLDIAEVEMLISDLLTSGRLELRHGTGGAVQLGRIDVAALLRRVAAKVGAEVEVAGQPELEADELLLERMLSNLLANARRACPSGRITVSARARGEALELAVEDEGPGVPEGQRGAIFNRFHSERPEEEFGRHSGLGLAIARAIAEGHGGSIGVGDRPDGRRGAWFELRVPRAQP